MTMPLEQDQRQNIEPSARLSSPIAQSTPPPPPPSLTTRPAIDPILSDDGDDIQASSTTSGKRNRGGRPRKATYNVDLTDREEAQLKQILNFIRSKRWTVSKLTTAMLGSEKHYKARSELRRSLLDNEMLVEDIAIQEGRADVVLLKELELLKTIPALAQYEMNGSETLHTIENGKLEADIRGVAPMLYKLLSALCTNHRNHTPPPFTRILAIISNICFTRGQRLSSYLPTILGVELHSKGVGRSVIQLCHSFGLTVSYSSTMNTINALSKGEAIANPEGVAITEESPPSPEQD